MQENINISICIPTYNKSETIEYTILSVINQSYKNWELIIIDDSNNSLTEEVVAKFSITDLRVKYIKNKERLGLVKNWNECIKQANFEYVYILHHDDFLMQGVLRAYNDFVNTNPECGLIHSNCYYITLPYYKKTKGETQDITIIEKGDKAVEKILFNNNLACSTVMVKKECYNKLGVFDESAWVSPDWEMWARIGEYYDFGHLNIIGCSVIIDNENTHLSAIDVNNLYKQQQYYYNKIISYFTEIYKKENPLILEKAEENLEKTILGLSIYYANHFNFRTAYSYLKKIRYKNIYRLTIQFGKILFRLRYLVFIKSKKNYKQVFELLYNENLEINEC